VDYKGAVIGCGYVSGFHVKAWSRVKDAQIVAVCDRIPEKAERRAAEFGIPAVYGDYRRMLDAESLDFVDIATPPETHLEIVTEAAAHGLQVLCQKPAAATLSELRAMVQICKEACVLFMVNENCRFQLWFRKMRALLHQGAIGRAYYANMTHRTRMTLPRMRQSGQHDLFVSMPRLVIYELGVHYLDTLRYLFGEADSVYAQMHHLSHSVMGEDMATLMLRIGEVTAVVDMSWASIPTVGNKRRVSWGEYTIEGTGGTLHLCIDGLLRLITDEGEQRYQFSPDSGLLSYQATQQHFVDCLHSGKEPETSGTETLKTMELVFGAYESAAHNRVYRTGSDAGHLE
jgi:predicted dehydrogenase